MSDYTVTVTEMCVKQQFAPCDCKACMVERLDKLTAQRDELLAALEKYADKDNWMCSDSSDSHDCERDSDKCCNDSWQGGVHGYEVARAAIALTKGDK